MKTSCSHQEQVRSEMSNSSNCKNCGAFISSKGVESLKDSNSMFWSEVGTHSHFLACF